MKSTCCTLLRLCLVLTLCTIPSNKQLVESFRTFSVAHTFETYEGDHTNRVPERIEQKVLPFFSNNLSFTAPRK